MKLCQNLRLVLVRTEPVSNQFFDDIFRKVNVFDLFWNFLPHVRKNDFLTKDHRKNDLTPVSSELESRKISERVS